MKIATLGPKGTYSVQAAITYDDTAEIAYGNTIQEVINGGSNPHPGNYFA